MRITNEPKVPAGSDTESANIGKEGKEPTAMSNQHSANDQRNLVPTHRDEQILASPKAKRRGNQEGSLSQRKDGRWMARISHEGRRIATYGKTKEEARKKLRELQRKQDQGLPLLTSAMPLQEYLQRWLVSIKNQLEKRQI